MEPYTLPPIQNIKKCFAAVPSYMHPNPSPHAVVWEGLLTDSECDSIVQYMMDFESYSFQGCGGATREAPLPLDPIFAPIISASIWLNHEYFGFRLSGTPGVWFQTYERGNGYQIHSDAMIGQTRKLTTVALLTDPDNYDGGVLRVVPYPEYYEIPKTRGTLVTFPAWVLHEVFPVKQGLRQTVNMGFWGPAFI